MPIPPVDPTAPANLAKRIITPFGRSKAGRWTFMNFSRYVDPTLVRLTGGRVSTLVFSPVVLLTHTGAKSGIKRTSPLLYFTDEGRVILIASDFGQNRHPAWWHNEKTTEGRQIPVMALSPID
jgi:F420H(2)-dependent quinone reductase